MAMRPYNPDPPLSTDRGVTRAANAGYLFACFRNSILLDVRRRAEQARQRILNTLQSNTLEVHCAVEGFGGWRRLRSLESAISRRDQGGGGGIS